MVIHKIEGMQASRQRAATPPPSEPTPLLTRTPRSAKEIILFGKKLQNNLEDHVDPAFYVHVDRFMRASIARAYSRQIAERDLIATHSQAAAKAARKKLDGRVAQKGGVITVRDVRAKVTKRSEDEVEKAMKVLERAGAAEDKRRLVVLNAIKKQWKGLFTEAKGVLQQRKKLHNERKKVVRVIGKGVAYRQKVDH